MTDSAFERNGDDGFAIHNEYSSLVEQVDATSMTVAGKGIDLALPGEDWVFRSRATLQPLATLRLVEVEPPEGEQLSNPRALLPVIQDALKGQGGEDGCVAIGTAELVMLEKDSQNAIKVYAEDKTGFAMAFYLPMDMTGPGEFAFGEVKQVASDTVIGGWGEGA